jgi:hypothetical protein
MKRRFTVDASRKIKASIIPYRQSTSDLINNENLDERFAYDLPHDFTIYVNGSTLPVLTVDSEVVLLEDYDPFVPEENDVGDPPTAVKYTILIPIYADTLEGDKTYTSVEQMQSVVRGGIEAFVDSEVYGTDYCGYPLNLTCREEDYSHFIPLADEELLHGHNPDYAIGYYLATVLIAPGCP